MPIPYLTGTKSISTGVEIGEKVAKPFGYFLTETVLPDAGRTEGYDDIKAQVVNGIDKGKGLGWCG